MQNFNIYLCGGMGKFGKKNFDEGNNWRLTCKKMFEKMSSKYIVYTFNPNDYFNFRDVPPLYESEAEVMNYDLRNLRKADLVIVNFNDMYSLGSMAEIAIAYERRIPIIGVNESKQSLHPWQVCMCDRIFKSFDEMKFYIRDFYLT